MIARQDNENLYLIYSDDLYTWDGGQAILKPEFPWEFVQIGNCGSPIELDEGWLLLTHGVGPVRKYSIGAALLDKNDPSKVLAPPSRTAVAARSVRPRRICSERRLYLRRDAPSRQDHLSLRGLGHLLQFRDDQDRLADCGDGLLTSRHLPPSRNEDDPSSDRRPSPDLLLFIGVLNANISWIRTDVGVDTFEARGIRYLRRTRCSWKSADKDKAAVGMRHLSRDYR